MHLRPLPIGVSVRQVLPRVALRRLAGHAALDPAPFRGGGGVRGWRVRPLGRTRHLFLQ